MIVGKSTRLRIDPETVDLIRKEVKALKMKDCASVDERLMRAIFPNKPEHWGPPEGLQLDVQLDDVELKRPKFEKRLRNNVIRRRAE